MTTALRDFIGNPAAYAQQNTDGTYTPVRAPIADWELKEHLEGKRTLGTYVVQYDKARFIVWDIDDHDLLMAKQIAEEAGKRGLHAGIEFSGRKGFHIWVLLDGWVNAGELMRLGKDIAREVGFNGEVFPKQAAVRDLGSLVKLPLGKHAVTGNPSRFLVEPKVNPVNAASLAVAKLPAPVVQTRKGVGQKCIDSIQDNPPGEGFRNNLYFHFACFMRRAGLHEEAIEAVLRELWHDPDPGELEEVVKNSEFSGPTCDNVPADRHCGAECIKNKMKGLSTRPGQLKHGIKGEKVVVEIGDNSNLPRNVLKIDHPDLSDGVGKMK